MKRKFLLFSIALLTSATAFAQGMGKPSAAEIATLPKWAQEMYKEQPNLFTVDSLYTAHFRKNKFEKSFHTQYYKRWRRAAIDNTDAQGNIHKPTAEDLAQL